MIYTPNLKPIFFLVMNDLNLTLSMNEIYLIDYFIGFVACVNGEKHSQQLLFGENHNFKIASQ